MQVLQDAVSYLDLVVKRARLRRQQRAQLDAAGRGTARVAAAAAAAAAASRHLRTAALCVHTQPSSAAAPRRARSRREGREPTRSLARAACATIHRVAMRTEIYLARAGSEL